MTPNCGLDENGEVNGCGLDRLKVGLDFANHLHATHAILTGKADPTQEDSHYLGQLIMSSRSYLPLVDLHTNGFLLEKDISLVDLRNYGLTNITFSIASFDEKANQSLMGFKELPIEAIKKAVGLQLHTRCSLVLNKSGVNDFSGIMEYIKAAGDLGVNAVVIREVWLPKISVHGAHEVYDWNRNNFIDLKAAMLRFKEVAASDNEFGLSERDPLPWGTPVFAVDGIFADRDHGVNVTFARCDEATSGRIIKSVIHKPNGHGYRNWDSNADILY